MSVSRAPGLQHAVKTKARCALPFRYNLCRLRAAHSCATPLGAAQNDRVYAAPTSDFVDESDVGGDSDVSMGDAPLWCATVPDFAAAVAQGRGEETWGIALPCDSSEAAVREAIGRAVGLSEDRADSDRADSGEESGRDAGASASVGRAPLTAQRRPNPNPPCRTNCRNASVPEELQAFVDGGGEAADAV
jgi:hypothetical protein